MSGDLEKIFQSNVRNLPTSFLPVTIYLINLLKLMINFLHTLRCEHGMRRKSLNFFLVGILMSECLNIIMNHFQ